MVYTWARQQKHVSGMNYNLEKSNEKEVIT
jgi:hypothetical protein